MSLFSLGLTVLCAAGLTPELAQCQYSRPALTKGITIRQNLNKPVPLDLVFQDEAGQTVPLRTYFGEKPVVFSMVYYKCPSLCPMSLRETVLGLRRLPMQAGIDYNVLVVSFDERDKPADSVRKKAEYERMFGRAGFNTGFHFLTGTHENIEKLASAIGFGFHWDEATQQYIHAAGIMMATPDGRMSRYFYGTDYAPADLRMGLVDSSENKISSPVNYLLTFCFHYDATQGKYTLAILNILKLGGAITLLMLAGLIYILMRNEKKQSSGSRWKGAHAAR